MNWFLRRVPVFMFISITEVVEVKWRSKFFPFFFFPNYRWNFLKEIKPIVLVFPSFTHSDKHTYGHGTAPPPDLHMHKPICYMWLSKISSASPSTFFIYKIPLVYRIVCKWPTGECNTYLLHESICILILLFPFLHIYCVSFVCVCARGAIRKLNGQSQWAKKRKIFECFFAFACRLHHNLRSMNWRRGWKLLRRRLAVCLLLVSYRSRRIMDKCSFIACSPNSLLSSGKLRSSIT